MLKEGTSLFRVIFRRATHGNERYAIDVHALNAERAYQKALDQLGDDSQLIEEDVEWVGDDRDWEWVATMQLERCGQCGRPHEVALIHKCPTG